MTLHEHLQLWALIVAGPSSVQPKKLEAARLALCFVITYYRLKLGASGVRDSKYLILIYGRLINRQEIILNTAVGRRVFQACSKNFFKLDVCRTCIIYVSNKFHARYRCFEYTLSAFGTRFRHANVRYPFFFYIYFLILVYFIFLIFCTSGTCLSHMQICDC